MTSEGRTALNGARIILVGNDRVVSDLLLANLAPHFDVTSVDSGEEAFKLNLADFDLIVVDTDLPGMSGYIFVQIAREEPAFSRVPFIFISKYDSEDDVLRGFDAGADDYIVKPISLRTTLARIQSVLRRHALSRGGAAGPAAAAGPAPGPEVIDFGALRLVPDAKRLEIEGERVSLSPKEYAILLLLVRRRGEYVSIEDIRDLVWPPEEKLSLRAVAVNVSRLRKRLGPYGAMILSEAGRGYGIL